MDVDGVVGVEAMADEGGVAEGFSKVYSHPLCVPPFSAGDAFCLQVRNGVGDGTQQNPFASAHRA